MQQDPHDQKHWSEQQHREFYKKLKKLNLQERSQALINQAQKLRLASAGSDADLLKAAESMMTFWTLNVGHNPDRKEAYALLRDIYTDLNEPEKAKKFLG